MLQEDYSYPLAKLREAVFILATGIGNAKSRVFEASKIIGVLTNDDFPKILEIRWGKIILSLTQTHSLIIPEIGVRSGAIEQTLKKMRNEKASKIAGEIYDLLIDFEQIANRGRIR